MTRPLIVVSNRLPFRAVREGRQLSLAPSPGGLVTALDPVLRANGGDWIGWSGLPREDLASHGGVTMPAEAGVSYVDVPLSAHEVGAYYHGFSNRTLWPLLHYFVGRTETDVATWRSYERVNERFARITAERLALRQALVWVHDYQLLRVPYHLRRRCADAAIAFFLHVPFPATDVFRILPWSRELLRGILAADFVGFHTTRYASNFLDSADELLGCVVDREAMTIRFEGRVVGVGVHAISIDTAEAEALTARLPRETARVRRVLAVDRLDYTKGIVHRLEAVERLLERYPQHRGEVHFSQVLVPSREHLSDYAELKRAVDENVGRINGRFSTERWTPIRYFARSLPRDELFAAYRDADVALVTPLRDGMNLVAKEYVMAHPEGEGVLVLSELAGAADELQEAVTVSPFDPDAVATALHRALTMPADERRARMLALRARVRAHDVHAWVDGFITAAEAAVTRARRDRPSAVDDVRNRLAPWLSKRPDLAVLLDFDGTLAPIVERPDLAALDPAMRAVLVDLRRNPDVDLAIVTGREMDDIRDRVGIPDITYVASHGFEISSPGLEWRHTAVDRYARAIAAAAEELRALGFPGALVEPKRTTVAFHYRGVSPERREEARSRAERVLRKRRLRVIAGKLVVEGRPPLDWNKGTAVLWVLGQRHGSGWPTHMRALYIGDDRTDEDAFTALKGLGRCIRVGAGDDIETAADDLLPDPDAVRELLRWCASGASLAAQT